MELIPVATGPARPGRLNAAGGTPPRLDTLPEHHTYRDLGCEVSPSCLRCPLPQCKHDEPGWYLRQQRAQRDRTMCQLRSREGLSITQLASRFGVSTRTVFRVLHQARDGAGVASGVG